MSKTIRHDTIQLRDGVAAANFTEFMNKELMPYFDKQYARVTRSSYASLVAQSLLKGTESERKWLWVTTWDGRSVRGPYFENAMMNKVAETEVMLKKLESFGEREAEEVYEEAGAGDH